ncbi:MAG TPA: hypothetical protein VLQ92_09045, partial [Candidatus Limnocylindrales bacterium]|nr:hypothetical protein [Candidatus Limnocylindrales bacterium]
ALAISGVLIGSAGAVALAGVLIDAGGSSWGLAVGSVSALAGLVVAALARPALGRAERPVESRDLQGPQEDPRVTGSSTGPDNRKRPAGRFTTVPAALPVPSDAGTTPPA